MTLSDETVLDETQIGKPTETEGYDIDVESFEKVDEEALAAFMAEQICLAMIQHDRREYDATVAAFYQVDRHQFVHLDDEQAYEAAKALADAFFRKDALEEPYIDGTTVGPTLADADWSPVEEILQRRAEIVGMSEEYAEQTVIGWRNHKVGGDYWTPMMIAQRHEIDAAMQGYPEKPKYGRSGYGPLPARYIVSVELHDMHTERHWEQAVEVMTGYYTEILAGQEAD